LLEEFDVYCIVSLPGGVFTAAGAGVKTNLVFFNKGKPTERIWYYDLSDVKVGKKKPFTLSHFEDFFRLLPKRGDGPASWTVDFSARQQQALEEARPHREKATELFARAKALEDDWRERRKAKTRGGDGSSLQIGTGDEASPPLAELEEQWRGVERAARESLAKGVAIEEAAFDLKAVNPNRVSQEDTRTPQQLLDYIAEKGLEADAALLRLRGLVLPPPS
jgi:type I restriction enzyme M protein